MEREILFLKIPSFPIALERARDPSLRGRPVAVCQAGTGGQGLLQAVSAEARREGLFKGMPRRKALEQCPGLRIVRPDPALYLRAAGALFGLLSNYSPLVEPARPGALFLDLSGTGRLFGPARDLAWKIRGEVARRLNLEPRLGMATNKLLSRIATKVLAGSGLCDVFPGGESHFLGPLDVELLPAARPPERAERLRELNLRRVEDLLAVPLRALEVAFGSAAVSLSLYRQARGLDASPVRPPRQTPRVTEEETLAEESNEDACLLAALQGLAEGAGRRLREMRALARRMEIEVEYADGVLAAGMARLVPPADLDGRLAEAARGLFERMVRRRVRVRRIALHCTELVPVPRQLSLFGPEELAECQLAEEEAVGGCRGSGLWGWGHWGQRPGVGGGRRSVAAVLEPTHGGTPFGAPVFGDGNPGGTPSVASAFGPWHATPCSPCGHEGPWAPITLEGRALSRPSSGTGTMEGRALSRPGEARRKRALQEALDEIRNRFGQGAVRTGGSNLAPTCRRRGPQGQHWP